MADPKFQKRSDAYQKGSGIREAITQIGEGARQGVKAVWAPVGMGLRAAGDFVEGVSGRRPAGYLNKETFISALPPGLGMAVNALEKGVGKLWSPGGALADKDAKTVAAPQQALGLKGQYAQGPDSYSNRAPDAQGLSGFEKQTGAGMQGVYDLETGNIVAPDDDRAARTIAWADSRGVPVMGSPSFAQAGGFAPQVASQDTGRRPTRTPRTMEDYLAGVRPRDGAGALLAMGLASKFASADMSAANREENLILRNEKLRQSDNALGIGRANAIANVMNAQAQGLRALGKSDKPIKFELTPSKPDTNAFPDKEGRLPMLPGSVKIGDTTYPLSDEDLSAAQSKAMQLVSQYMEAYPDATETPEELLSRFGQQAVVAVIRSRGAAPTGE